ncbi:hypothetical protein MMC12_002275 [Toensbergia leucococca]|nr:hypothetical protein [Toensbergia leucococca]
MADIILAAVGLGVAVPGLVIGFAECGVYIKARVDQFNNAPSTVLELGKFAQDLSTGGLKEQLNLAAWAHSRNDIDDTLKASIEDQVERLRTALIAADKALDKLFDKDGRVKRTYFVFIGQRKMKLIIENLEQLHKSFWRSISLIEMRVRVLPDPLFLSTSHFKTYTQTDGEYCSQLEPQSHLWRAKGQLLDEKVREVNVIIEQKRKITTGLDEVKDIASCLSQQASSGLQPNGTLKCLGYRESPNLELIFEIPKNFDFENLQTLEGVILNDVNKGYGGARPLDHRFRLSLQIAEAVLMVHTLNRVHKNLRPDTILMLRSLESATDNVDFGVPFLTNWIMLRKIDAPSSMVGENDWLRDMYRHPRRQGLQPEERYNMGHDIYSLGVCLLEIGLWEPLISTCEGKRLPCAWYVAMALKIGCIKHGETENIKLLTKPIVMRKTLVALAQQELPSRMGMAFAEMVISCLTCLEGGFGDVGEFEENKIAIGLKFDEMIIQPLSKLSTCFHSGGI